MTGFPSRRAVVLSSLLGGSTGALSLQGAGGGIAEGSSAPESIDLPTDPGRTVTTERRGDVFLIGIKRPHVHNRIDPETCRALARAYGVFDRDPLLRAAVLFGHTALAEGDGAAFARMGDQYRGLYSTEDFREGRKAEAEGRPPVYHGR